MFLYEGIRKIKWFRSIQQSNVIDAMEQNDEEVLATDAVQEIDSNEDEGNLEGCDIIHRLLI